MSGNRYSEFEIVKAPDLPRKFQLWSHQWIGIPLLLAIPLLALFGVFGGSTESTRASSDSLELSVEYPKRLRYGFPEEIRIGLSNKSTETIEQAQVKVNEAFLRSFDDVTFTPELDNASEISLDHLKPGETRHITVDLRGKEYGSHGGDISASLDGRVVARAEIESFVFP